MAFVYMVRCIDGSLYVGWTEDVEARVSMHNEGRGGPYTMRRRPVTLVLVEPHDTAESARARERQLKRWSSGKKEALIAADASALKSLAVSHASPRYRKEHA